MTEEERAERTRAYQQKYNASEKGKERWRRYGRSEKGKANHKRAQARYIRTVRGRELKARNNERRLRVDGMYLGTLGFTNLEIEEMKANGKIV